jgi:hypothetical protein
MSTCSEYWIVKRKNSLTAEGVDYIGSLNLALIIKKCEGLLVDTISHIVRILGLRVHVCVHEVYVAGRLLSLTPDKPVTR